MVATRSYALDDAQQAEIKNLFDRLPISAIKRVPQTCDLEIKNGEHTLKVYMVNDNPSAPVSYHNNPQYRYILETDGLKGEISKELFHHMYARMDMYSPDNTLPSSIVTRSILTALS